jgi:mxaD protein
MGTAQAKIDIDKDPDAVWAVVGDFGGLAAWMPGIDSCTVSGDERTLSMLGMEIVEREFARDDAGRSLTYGIVGGGLTVDHHRATITVSSAGTGSHVSWDVEVEPDTLTSIMEQTYQGALEALRGHLGA